jgi:hypothetical protein
VTADLVEFLRARLTEDEQAAREAMHRPRNRPATSGRWGYVHEDLVDEDGLVLAPKVWIPAAAHTARWDPARVLTDIEAKRRILDRYVAAEEHAAGTYDEVSGGIAQGLEFAVRAHAHPHAEHPAYRPEWAPDEEDSRG